MTDRDHIDPAAGEPVPTSDAEPRPQRPTHDRPVAGSGSATEATPASPESMRPGEEFADDITATDKALGGTATASTLRKVVEAILIVADQPVTDVEIAQVTEHPRAAVSDVLRDLGDGYAQDDRGFTLREVAGGWRLYSAPDCAGYVERFVLEGQQTRLTQAALETLAVVAYRQPVTRASISAIRGVNVEGVVRTLVARGLIEEVGQETSGATLYATTTFFLSRLGLNSVEELPSLAPFLPVDIDSIAEQL
jgi:segregation and condensation protein B